MTTTSPESMMEEARWIAEMTRRVLDVLGSNDEVKIIENFEGDTPAVSVEAEGITVHRRLVEVNTIAGKKLTSQFIVSEPEIVYWASRDQPDDVEIVESEFPMASLAVQKVGIIVAERKIRNALGF